MIFFLLSCFLQKSFALPTITHEVYIDVCIDKVRSGRIELGFFGSACPNALSAIERGLRCHYGDYCYRGTYFTNYITNNSVTIGAEFEDKGLKYQSDFAPCPPNQAYLLCYVPYEGHPSGKLFFTLKAEADVPQNAIPIAKVITGQNVLKRIMQFAASGGDVDTGVRISSCGIKDFKDPDVDL